MPYITREDGERFIIPSYRDTLSAKKPALLKKEILLLSQNYGEYITLQRKNVDQYEAAFSPDAGYLLGETVWHNFKRPRDLIYCEAIPNTLEAILVIVKSGSVYLDGTFPVDSIADELVIFKTQQNNFDIYIYGDVPISQAQEEGKFSLSSSSVQSFNVLTEPVFPTLPTVKNFQLRLVEAVLKEQGIGVFPVKQALAGVVVLGAVWFILNFFATHRKEIPQVFVSVVNPYQNYIEQLSTPSPTSQLNALANVIMSIGTIPGWSPGTVTYKDGVASATLISEGADFSILFGWISRHNAKLVIVPEGIIITMTAAAEYRQAPTTITTAQQAIAEVLDRVHVVLGGNAVAMTPAVDKGRYTETSITINLDNITLNTLNLVARQFEGLPLVLVKADLSLPTQGSISGTLTLKALGN